MTGVGRCDVLPPRESSADRPASAPPIEQGAKR